MTIHCNLKISANPRAEVIWYKENKATKEKEQIQDNDKYALNQQDDQRLKAEEKWYTLEIKIVQGNDYGTYYCSGRNQFGSSEAKFVLFGKFCVVILSDFVGLKILTFCLEEGGRVLTSIYDAQFRPTVSFLTMQTIPFTL